MVLCLSLVCKTLLFFKIFRLFRILANFFTKIMEAIIDDIRKPTKAEQKAAFVSYKTLIAAVE